VIGLLSLLLMTTAAEAPMTEDGNRAVALEVSEVGNRIEVKLVSLPGKRQTLSYSLEVMGRSTSKHRGKTTVAGDARKVLSTITSEASADWCVRASIDEENGNSYEIVEGPCSAA
jgi:hypothetical protein